MKFHHFPSPPSPPSPEKQLDKAREHFLYAGDPVNFGLLLVEMAGPEREGAEALITGAVLQWVMWPPPLHLIGQQFYYPQIIGATWFAVSYQYIYCLL